MINPLGLVTLSGIGDEVSTIPQKLIPSWVAFVIQFAALMVLILIVFFVGYKPLKKMLKKRADYIENNIKEAETSKALAERDAKQAEEMILASKKEANEILEAANKQGEKIKEEMILEGQNEVSKMKAAAQEDIKRSQEEALEAIHNEMVDVALTATSELLKREISKEDNERLAEEFIKNLN